MKDAISDMANRRSEEICVLLYNRMFCIEFHIFMETGGIRVPDETPDRFVAVVFREAAREVLEEMIKEEAQAAGGEAHAAA